MPGTNELSVTEPVQATDIFKRELLTTQFYQDRDKMLNLNSKKMITTTFLPHP